jgi:putative oxidoreductase
MKIAVIIARILMGLMFLQASVVYFMKWYPQDQIPPKEVMTYMTGISVVHLMEIVKALELLCAIALLSGRYVALALIVLFPITFNIVLLHAMADQGALVIAVAILAVHLFLLYAYRKHYTALFTPKRIE